MRVCLLLCMRSMSCCPDVDSLSPGSQLTHNLNWILSILNSHLSLSRIHFCCRQVRYKCACPFSQSRSHFLTLFICLCLLLEQHRCGVSWLLSFQGDGWHVDTGHLAPQRGSKVFRWLPGDRINSTRTNFIARTVNLESGGFDHGRSGTMD